MAGDIRPRAVFCGLKDLKALKVLEAGPGGCWGAPGKWGSDGQGSAGCWCRAPPAPAQSRGQISALPGKLMPKRLAEVPALENQPWGVRAQKLAPSWARDSTGCSRAASWWLHRARCRARGQAATDPCGRGKDGGHKATPRPTSADCPAVPLAHPRPAQVGRCPAGATGTLLSPHLPLQPLALADSGAAGSFSSPCPHFPIQDIWVSSTRRRLICPLIPQAGGARPHRRLPWGLPPLEDINAAPQQRALCTSQPLYQGFPTQHMGMGQPPGHQTACSRTGTRVAELCAPPQATP